MATKKRNNKDTTSDNKNDENKGQDIGAHKEKAPTLDRKKVPLPPPLKIPYTGRIKLPVLPTLKIPTLDRMKVPVLPTLKIPYTGRIKLPLPDVSMVSREQELEDEIVELRRAIVDSVIKKEREIKKRQDQIEELNKKLRLHYLLDRVKESARIKLLEPESEEFREIFEKRESCNAFVISVDIRRSTELMLRAREPQFYADFIVTLCAELTTIILNNYGVFDKFTGDGILAFFPDFYSGEDAAYLAIRAADECHSCFSGLYKQKRSSFNAVLMDVGLGIGIDYGLSHLIKLQDGLTVIGNPVVYACRMSGAKAGLTLLNQPAYELISEHFSKHVSLQESEIDIKHEGNILAYIATLSKKVYEPKLPDWEKPLTSPES